MSIRARSQIGARFKFSEARAVGLTFGVVTCHRV